MALAKNGMTASAEANQRRQVHASALERREG